MLLFVGLGNPGAKHAGNRHNIGFMAVEAIAKRHGFPPWRSSLQGFATKTSIGSEEVLLLKPQTYMNLSGQSVAEAVRFFKIRQPTHIVVFHDEIELPPGVVKVRTGGSDRGHNGLRSMSALLGKEYRRVCLGVGRPAEKPMVHDYVLDDFSSSELMWVGALCAVVAHNARLLVLGEDADFQMRVNAEMQATGLVSGRR